MQNYNWLIRLHGNVYHMEPTTRHTEGSARFYFLPEGSYADMALPDISFDNLSMLHPGYSGEFWYVYADRVEHIKDLIDLFDQIKKGELLEIALATPPVMLEFINHRRCLTKFASLGLDFQNWYEQFRPWVNSAPARGFEWVIDEPVFN